MNGDDLVSLIAHELRTPLAAVIGSARTLEERWGELTDEERELLLHVIVGESDRLNMLISDLLDSSRIEAGTFSYEFGNVDLAELVDEEVAAVGVIYGDVDVHASLNGPLPPVSGDRRRLGQVLANLLDNAAKWSPAGGEVVVTASAAGGAVRVEVADRGPGIPAEYHQRVFEKFGRVPGSGKPGTGLGLFISRSIAEAHGGTLRLRSEHGEGAVFTLELPA